MLRITLIEIASFLVPFLLFFLWRLQSSSEALKPTPVLKLSAAGALLAVFVLLGLVWFESARGGHEGDCYVPARVVDGEIVPGYFRRGDCGAGQEDEDGQPG